MLTRTPETETETPVRLTLKEQVAELERAIIVETLHRRRWRLGKVAMELGLSRTGLANKMKRYGLGGGEE